MGVCVCQDEDRTLDAAVSDCSGVSSPKRRFIEECEEEEEAGKKELEESEVSTAGVLRVL